MATASCTGPGVAGGGGALRAGSFDGDCTGWYPVAGDADGSAPIVGGVDGSAPFVVDVEPVLLTAGTPTGGGGATRDGTNNGCCPSCPEIVPAAACVRGPAIEAVNPVAEVATSVRSGSDLRCLGRGLATGRGSCRVDDSTVPLASSVGPGAFGAAFRGICGRGGGVCFVIDVVDTAASRISRRGTAEAPVAPPLCVDTKPSLARLILGEFRGDAATKNAPGPN